VMIKPGLQISAFSPMRFDSDGDLVDDDIQGLLKKHLDAFAEWITQLALPCDFVKHACEMDVLSKVD
jgi:hypothetical protein